MKGGRGGERRRIAHWGEREGKNPRAKVAGKGWSTTVIGKEEKVR